MPRSNRLSLREKLGLIAAFFCSITLGALRRPFDIEATMDRELKELAIGSCALALFGVLLVKWPPLGAFIANALHYVSFEPGH